MAHYAAYVRNLKKTKWCLIGFGVDRPEAEMKLEIRLRNHPKGTKTGIRKYNDHEDAPEYTEKLRG